MDASLAINGQAPPVPSGQPTGRKTTETASPNERDPHAVQRRWLIDHIDQPVRIRLMDGKMLTGTLLAFDQFSLLLLSGGSRILLYKQSISYMAPEQKADTTVT